MASLGELFISLGFDVDDTKLKAFKGGLEDTKEAMAKLGRVSSEVVGIATAGIGALSLFVQNSADRAVNMNNMAIMFGANADAAQEFANALHVVNSQISTAQGMGIFGKFSEVVKGLVPLGSQQGNAISLLGGYAGENSFLGTSAEAVIAHLAENYKNAKGRFGDAYSSKLSQAGLDPGVEVLVRRIAEDPALLEKYKQYNMTPDQRERTRAFASSTAEFHIAIDTFENTVSSALAPALTEFFNGATSLVKYLTSDKMGDQLLQQKEREKKLGFWDWLILDPLLQVAGLRDSGNKSAGDDISQTFVNFVQGSKIGGSWSKLSAVDREAAMYWISHVEDGKLDPKAFNGAGGGHGAKGIAQWRGKRQELFKQLTGHDLLQGSLQEQQDFLAYELMTTHKNALSKMDSENTRQGKINAFGKYFEAGDHGPITINIHSNAKDNKEVADLVIQHMQKDRNIANAQTNTGGY